MDFLIFQVNMKYLDKEINDMLFNKIIEQRNLMNVQDIVSLI